jgi:hypothetical protein
MSLFGFGDIKFNKQNSRNFGPLSALEGTEFEKNTFRYPIDVGSTDKGHYMVIYIRQQKNSQFKGKELGESAIPVTKGASAASQTLGANIGSASGAFGGELLSKVNGGLNSINSSSGGKFASLTNAASKSISSALGGVNSVTGKIGNLFGQASLFSGNSESTKAVLDTSIKKITGGSLGFLKTTTLTTDAIALYMPDTLNYTYAQGYDQLTLGGEIGGQLLAAGKSSVDAFKSGGGLMEAGKSILKSGASLATQKAFQAGGELIGSGQTAQAAFTAATGTVQNPMLEMIYKSPNFRQFQFDFTFYPRDEKEALEVQKIIERLRFHQAPELASAQGFLIPPSEFDIKFYYGSSQNPNIPAIATCVLTNIDVNYAPNGFSAYEVPGENNPSLGRTGMPVAIQVLLQFQETTYLTKSDFKNFQGAGVNQRKEGI